MVLIGIASEMLILAFIIFHPFANTIFNTAPIPLEYILLAVPFALLLFAADEIRKYLISHGSTRVRNLLGW
jgi:sodium/potassium-transporting ATPase subunit alpha